MINFPNINREIISIGPLAISWYSMSYVTGILVGWYYMTKLIKINKIKDISKENIEDFISWAIIAIILGGRLGYVLFYDPVKYFSNPIEILKTYEGGMSFHGGALAFIIATICFCKKNKIQFLKLLDLASAATPIGLFFGRIANFINAELYGRPTNLPWGVIFPGEDFARHPSQLYESILEGAVIFIVIFVISTKYNALKRPGLVTGLAMLLYSIFRSFIELFREPDAHIGFVFNYFTMGQLLCIPMFIIGFTLIIRSYKQKT